MTQAWEKVPDSKKGKNPKRSSDPNENPTIRFSIVENLVLILNKKKQVFLTESKERHQNLKRTEITSYVKVAASSSTPRSLC